MEKIIKDSELKGSLKVNYSRRSSDIQQPVGTMPALETKACVYPLLCHLDSSCITLDMWLLCSGLQSPHLYNDRVTIKVSFHPDIL